MYRARELVMGEQKQITDQEIKLINIQIVEQINLDEFEVEVENENQKSAYYYGNSNSSWTSYMDRC